jgi:HAD superfamily hydrolase (TIGR01509 family)
MGIVTNTCREAANRMLNMHGIGEFFDVTITREEVKMLKPEPEGIRLALKRLKAQRFVFVGDLIHDVRAAEKAGGTSIIVNREPSKRLDFQADYVVESLTKIPELVQRIADK